MEEMFRLRVASQENYHAGLVHLSGMTALRDLTLADCADEEKAMVQNLKSLILDHSLATIAVSAELRATMSAAALQLPCHWISARTVTSEECRRFFGHRN